MGLFFLVLVSVGTWAQQGPGDDKEISLLKTTHVYKDTLALDYYTIASHTSESAEDSSKKPLVVLVHGGGFYEGHRDGPGDLQRSHREPGPRAGVHATGLQHAHALQPDARRRPRDALRARTLAPRVRARG